MGPQFSLGLCEIQQKLWLSWPLPAFATYNRKLKSRLAKLRCSDREFWTLTKEVGRIDENSLGLRGRGVLV